MEWIPIKNYEGLYEINSLGQIKSLPKHSRWGRLTKEKILKSKGRSNVYCFLGLYKNRIRTTLSEHRLIAMHFIPNPENKPCVNHINGIRNDNRIENLEWCTHSENTFHAHRTGLSKNSELQKSILIENNKILHSKKTINIITGEKFSSIKEAALSLQIKMKTLSAKLTGQLTNNTNIRYERDLPN